MAFFVFLIGIDYTLLSNYLIVEFTSEMYVGHPVYVGLI
jgi:hypothetical protein